MSKKKSSHVSVDIECDGPIIGKHSMISFGFVIVEEGLTRSFYREIKPIGDDYDPGALGVSGFTRNETLAFMDPATAIKESVQWLTENISGRPIFWADNPAFDFSWLNWYYLTMHGSNPFGWSARRIGDVYCGMQKDGYAKWKFLRNTKHSHNAEDDARGNAEALLEMKKMGFKM